MGKSFLVIGTYTGVENTLSEMPDETQKMNVFHFSWETLNYQGRDSVGSFLTCHFYQFYLPLEWNCCPWLPWFQPLWLSFCQLPIIISVYQHRSKDEDMLTFTTPTLAVQNRLRECNICTARALGKGLCINEMQVFKLWPRGDLKSSVTLHVYSQTIDWTPNVLSQHAQDSVLTLELAAWVGSCFKILVKSWKWLWHSDRSWKPKVHSFSWMDENRFLKPGLQAT